MALADSRTQRLVVLCAMYLAQGIPWGFMTIALVSYLTARGVGDAAAGNLTAVVLLPWTFKLVWAPLIDTIRIRSMGRRRPWIIGAQMLMAVSLLGLLALGDLTENLGLLAWMFFLHNCFAALQDVATDALALDILPPSEQGRTNGVMWGSKLIGKAIGASGMALVIAHWSLSTAVLVQFLVLLVIMLLPVFMLERAGEKRFPWSRGTALDVTSGWGLRHPTEVLKDLIRAFGLTTTFLFFVFGTLKLVGWGIVEIITKTLYTQQLGWSFVEVSSVSAYGVITEMAGALAGGYIADRIGRRTAMIIGFGSYGLLALIFAALPQLWDDAWFTTGYLFLNPGVLAMGSVGFLSMAMNLSWTAAAATMFTVYMTVSNIGHVFGNWFVGLLRERWELSYVESFTVAGLVTVAPLLVLPLVRPAQVEEMRQQERLAAVPLHHAAFVEG